MLIRTTRFSRKKAVFAVLLMGVVMAVLIVLVGRMPPEEEAAPPRLVSNEDRVAYLLSLGWQVESEPAETLQFLMPKELAEPYLSYNELQLPQGFDLSGCCGKQVSRYTYTVINYPDRPTGVQANLYVCEELPAAGDIWCPGAGGFQEALVRAQSPE